MLARGTIRLIGGGTEPLRDRLHRQRHERLGTCRTNGSMRLASRSARSFRHHCSTIAPRLCRPGRTTCLRWYGASRDEVLSKVEIIRALLGDACRGHDVPVLTRIPRRRPGWHCRAAGNYFPAPKKKTRKMDHAQRRRGLSPRGLGLFWTWPCCPVPAREGRLLSLRGRRAATDRRFAAGGAGCRMGRAASVRATDRDTMRKLHAATASHCWSPRWLRPSPVPIGPASHVAI